MPVGKVSSTDWNQHSCLEKLVKFFAGVLVGHGGA